MPLCGRTNEIHRPVTLYVERMPDSMKVKTKSSAILLSVVLVIAVVLTVMIVLLHSALDYKIMDHTERLKAQLEREYQVSPSQLIESVEVLRPWYSMTPTDWTYVVTFSAGSESAAYRYQLIDGKYVFSRS